MLTARLSRKQPSAFLLFRIGLTIVLPALLFFAQTQTYLSLERACALKLFLPSSDFQGQARFREIKSADQLFLFFVSEVALALLANLMPTTDAPPPMHMFFRGLSLVTMSFNVLITAVWLTRLLFKDLDVGDLEPSMLGQVGDKWTQLSVLSSEKVVWLRKVLADQADTQAQNGDFWELMLTYSPSHRDYRPEQPLKPVSKLLSIISWNSLNG